MRIGGLEIEASVSIPLESIYACLVYTVCDTAPEEKEDPQILASTFRVVGCNFKQQISCHKVVLPKAVLKNSVNKLFTLFIQCSDF